MTGKPDMQDEKDMKMIPHDLLENITNYIFVLLLMCTSLLVKIGDTGTFLLNRAATLSRSARNYQSEEVTKIR